MDMFGMQCADGLSILGIGGALLALAFLAGALFHAYVLAKDPE